jgi:hypothetical protein
VNSIIVYTVAATCSGGSCPPTSQAITVTQPAPVIVYQAAPKPLLPIFQVRPQVYVIQAK